MNSNLNVIRSLKGRLRKEPSYGERAFSVARYWSNEELRRFAPLFEGNVVNVSAWEDRDKQGATYKDYFTRAAQYSITNFGTDQGVIQGRADEIFLDLEDDLDATLKGRFDVVFNHTTLEHVWRFNKAFDNLCALSADIVIVVVPWLQPLHTDYGDFWRFSPQAIARMFDERGLTTLYLSWNDHARSSVYVFGIATHAPERWKQPFVDTIIDPTNPDFLKLPSNWAGCSTFE